MPQLNELPTWESIWELWNNQDVPEVLIRGFDLSAHNYALPWWKRSENRQALVTAPPQRSTAYHLASILPEQPEELRAAYKIYAFCKVVGADWTILHVLEDVHKRHGSALYEWWTANSRHVLPYTENSPENSYGTRAELRDWRTSITAAATKWAQIATQWEVVRIPEFMDHGSDERRAYDKYVQDLHESQERAEYDRLKAKFERES